MDPIIRTCKLASALLAFAAVPAMALPVDEKAEAKALDQYVDARLAEIGSRNADAVTVYLKLQKLAPQSEILADRLFAAAIRAGDIPSAVRAVRSQELRDATSNEGPLLLYADAFRRKNWAMASLAATQLEAESYFGFMAPLLRSWADVGQGKDYLLPQADPKTDPYLAYYSVDQRVYLDLVLGKFAQSKVSLRALAIGGADFPRDLLIRAAPVYAAKGESDFAAAILSPVVDQEYAASISAVTSKDPSAKLTAEEGLAALHSRIAVTLLEQKSGEQALIFARIANWLSPRDHGIHIVLADALDDQGLGEEAAKIRALVPLKSPYWTRAVADGIQQYGNQDHFQAALALAKKARTMRPRAASMLILLARAQEQAGDIVDAVKSYRQLVDDADYARAPAQQRAQYRLMLATALDNSDQWPEALKTLEIAYQLDPQNTNIVNYLGYSLLDKKQDVERATGLIETAYRLSPQSTAVTDSLGWAKFHQGRFVEAVELLEKAAKAAGNDLTINEHLGDAYWQAGRRVDARYAWRVAAMTADGADAQRLAGKLDIGLSAAAQKP